MKFTKFTDLNKFKEESDKNKDNPDIWITKFEREINTAYDAYEFLHAHPNAIDPDSKKEWEKLSLRDRWLESGGQFLRNIDFYLDEEGIYLETGPIYWNNWTKTWGSNMHDVRLDVHAKTFEEALIKLAKKVRKHYGNY